MTRTVELERVCSWFSCVGARADSWIVVRAQALRLWSGYFAVADQPRPAMPQGPDELALFAPPQSAQHFANCMNGELLAAHDGHSESVLLREGEHGVIVRFFARLSGVPAHRVRTSCIELACCTREVGVHVMHPVHLLGELVHDLDVDAQDVSAALSRLHVAIDCARGFIRQAVDGGRLRDALRLNEAVHGYAVSPAGLSLSARHDVPIINALSLDARLPESFHARDYPLMLRTLGERLRLCPQPRPKALAPRRPRTDGEVFVVESMLLSEGRVWLVLRSESGQRIEHPASRAHVIRHGDSVRVLADGDVQVIARGGIS